MAIDIDNFNHSSLVYSIAIITFLTFPSLAQNHANSPVFRDYQPPSLHVAHRESSFAREWNTFMLIRDANSGDANAQHELGVRYLFGQGFATDTSKAVYWIKKSAEQNFMMAQYNLGLLYYHAWGVEWNPFEAYKLFFITAERGLPEAQFALGLSYTDNLLVQKNWITAYRWLKKAHDAGFKPATETIHELIAARFITQSDTVKANKLESEDKKISVTQNSSTVSTRTKTNPSSLSSASKNWEPVFLDFQPDTSKQNVDEHTLLNEVISSSHASHEDSLALLKCLESKTFCDSAALHFLDRAAEVGNPEALVFLARCYQDGIIVNQNLIRSAVYYLRAMYHDASRAPKLLSDLLRASDFERQLKSRAMRNDPDAQFVWGGLVALGIDRQITEKQAVELLQSSAIQNQQDAIIQLGQYYYTGKWVPQNRQKAIELWERAVRLGNQEAQVRIASVIIVGGKLFADYDVELTILRDASQLGSTLAKRALAVCYDEGRGVIQNKYEAVKLYRYCAQHGNRAAYQELQRMYNALRPADAIFQIQE